MSRVRPVYIVTTGQYSDYRIEAVFEDEKEAEKYAEFCNQEGDWSYNTAEVEEFLLNEPAERGYPFTVELDYNGNVESTRQIWPQFENESEQFKISKHPDSSISYSFYVRAKSREQAIKIAHEKWAMLKANNVTSPEALEAFRGKQELSDEED